MIFNTKLFLSFALVVLFVTARCSILPSGEQVSDDASFTTVALLALASTADSTNGNGGNLDQPQDDTAIMILNGERQTLSQKNSCANNDVGFQPDAGTTTPSINLHNLDLTQTSVTISSSDTTLDVDTASGTLNPTGTCAATVFETTATIYDLQVLDCALSGGNTISFRLRCVP